jgi:hypothetical protein
MNEVRTDSTLGLQRCPGCRYYTPRHQPTCANCGRPLAGSPAVTDPDEPIVTASAEPAGNPTGDRPGSRRIRRAIVLAVSGLAVVVAAALFWQSRTGPGSGQPVALGTSAPVVASSTTTKAPAPTTSAAPRSTEGTAPSDDWACARWFDLRRFASNGVLNSPDVIDKAKGIEDVAATPAVKVPAGRLVVAATQKDFQALSEAITGLNTACQ